MSLFLTWNYFQAGVSVLAVKRTAVGLNGTNDNKMGVFYI